MLSSILFELINLNYKLNLLLKYLSSNKINNIYINKILNKYKNNNIKDKIIKIYNLLIIKYIKYILNLCIELTNFINKNKTEIEINNLIYDENKMKKQQFILFNLYLIKLHLLNPFVILSDLYLLRRLLDKNYTKNNIIYCNMCSLSNITILLVKYFNFKITNVYYNTHFSNEIDKLNINNYIDYTNLLYTQTKYLINNNNKYPDQCVNLFNFPSNFT
jgi:hypothetical protein